VDAGQFSHVLFSTVIHIFTMADPWPGTHDGPPYGAPNPNAQGAQPPTGAAFSRPFSLYEALPYTPFSSIAPFDSSTLHPLTHACAFAYFGGNFSVSDLFPLYRRSSVAINRFSVPGTSCERSRPRPRFHCTQRRGFNTEPLLQTPPTSSRSRSTFIGERQYSRVVRFDLSRGTTSADSLKQVQNGPEGL
jgi:hypothetical protein